MRCLSPVPQDVVWRPKRDQTQTDRDRNCFHHNARTFLPFSVTNAVVGQKQWWGSHWPLSVNSPLPHTGKDQRLNRPTLLKCFPNETVKIMDFTDSQPLSPRVLNVRSVKWKAPGELRVGYQSTKAARGEASVRLFEFQAELATPFTENHFYWDKWLTQRWLCRQRYLTDIF